MSALVWLIDVTENVWQKKMFLHVNWSLHVHPWGWVLALGYSKDMDSKTGTYNTHGWSLRGVWKGSTPPWGNHCRGYLGFPVSFKSWFLNICKTDWFCWCREYKILNKMWCCMTVIKLRVKIKPQKFTSGYRCISCHQPSATWQPTGD